MNKDVAVYCRLFKYLTLFMYGGIIYYHIEIAWRGHSHHSMVIAGGICFLLIGALNNYLPWNLGLVYQSLIGALIITIIELIVGLIVNIWLGLAVWDYSGLPLNLWGQISLPFTLLWVPLAAVGIFLDDFLRLKLFGQTMEGYSLF